MLSRWVDAQRWSVVVREVSCGATVFVDVIFCAVSENGI